MIAYIGYFGAGKTYSMTRDLWKEKQKGKVIITNYTTTFSDIILKEKDEFVDFLLFLYEILTVNPEIGKKFIVGIDEVGIYFNSREFQSFPKFLVNFLLQLRKLDCEVFYTVQSPVFAEKTLREITTNWYTHKRLIPFLPFRVSGDWELNPDSPSTLGSGTGGNTYLGKRCFFMFRKKFFAMYNTKEILVRSQKELTVFQKEAKRQEWQEVLFPVETVQRGELRSPTLEKIEAEPPKHFITKKERRGFPFVWSPAKDCRHDTV